MELDNTLRDYYIEFYEVIDELLATYIKVNNLPSYVATVLFEKSYGLKEQYNNFRSEWMSVIDGKEFLKDNLIPDILIERTTVMPDVKIPMPEVLESLGYRLAVYVYNNRQLKYLQPLINTINRPLLLLCEQSVDLSLEMPEYVQAVDLDYSLADKYVTNENRLVRKLRIHYILLNSLLNAIKLDGVVLLEGCHFQEQMLAEIAKNLNIPAVAIQQGWPSMMHTMFRRLPYTYFLTWGEAFNSLWGEYNPKPKYLAAGYPYPVKAKSGKAISFFLQSPLFLSSCEYYDKMIDLIAETAKRLPDKNILVREHPEYRMSTDAFGMLCGFPNVKIVTDYSLENVFSLTEIVVSHFSSSIVEGIAHGCIPIVFDPTTDSNYMPDVESLGIGCKSKTVSEFFDKIALIQSRKEDYVRALESQQKNYFKAIDKDAILNQSVEVNSIVPMKNKLFVSNKLNIGCGRNIMKGWLNADLYNVSTDVLQMDASRPFPFADDTFDYIFSEHMFEHLDLCGQQNMLKESYRTLKLGGVLRIAMPDFNFLIDLVNNPDSEINSKYLDWSYNIFVSKNVDFEVSRSNYPVYVVNNFMHDWGHQFIHSKHSLIEMGQSCGFANAEVCKAGSSTHSALCDCEKHHNEIPVWANNLETFVVEFSKHCNDR